MCRMINGLGVTGTEILRRTTNTVNYGGELPLAQGIVFE